jgi:hypothetical protein
MTSEWGRPFAEQPPIDQLAVSGFDGLFKRDVAPDVPFLGILMAALEFEDDAPRHTRKIADELHLCSEHLSMGALGEEILPDFLQDVGGVEETQERLVKAAPDLPENDRSVGIDDFLGCIIVTGADPRQQGLQSARLFGHDYSPWERAEATKGWLRTWSNG